ncbi:MAG: hypothetical protein M1817_002343 [Caeruleum heppii]|nr:MAG: hypothetical protein M1817_003472 [Caeruleum heppii]KAI9673705.1 MAG: hypothetical protein M1817_002343 [Caeruleum heppii]
MAKDPHPSVTIYQLEQPEPLKQVLQHDRTQIDDCTSCRVMGASAFIGLGAYSYFSGRHQLRQQQAAIVKSGSRLGLQARQTGITGIAMSLVGMGIWRLVN